MENSVTPFIIGEIKPPKQQAQKDHDDDGDDPVIAGQLPPDLGNTPRSQIQVVSADPCDKAQPDNACKDRRRDDGREFERRSLGSSS